MMRLQGLLAVWALLSASSSGIDIVPTDNANALAAAIFSDVGLTILSSSFEGASLAAGTFTNGPFGIGSGSILTSGLAANAAPGGNLIIENGAAGSIPYCGSGTNDGSILTVELAIGVGFNGLLVQMIVASGEDGAYADPVGVFVDGVQYANDANGNRITVTNAYVRPPISIRQPNNDLSYADASPPLSYGIPITPGSHTVVLAVCDITDRTLDSGLMINAKSCVDCDRPIKVNYATTSTTITSDVESTFTSTIPASGTVSGTFVVVTQLVSLTTTAEETTTIQVDSTTKVEAGSTTTIEADTTTTIEADTTTTTGELTTTTVIYTTASSAGVSTTTAETEPTSTTTEEEPITTTTETTSIITTGESLPAISTISVSTTRLDTAGSTTTRIKTTTAYTSEHTTMITDDVDSSNVGTAESTTLSSQTFAVTDTTSPSTTLEDSETSKLVATTNAISGEENNEANTSTTHGVPPIQVESSDQLSTTIISTQLTEFPTSSFPTTKSPLTTSSPTARNLQFIAQHFFRGCIGSSEGYPTFTEVSNDPDMTTEKCIALAAGSKYVGIYQQSCYKADSLSDTDFLPIASCDLLCPGDRTLYCGGNIGDTLRRRAIASNRLLTLYSLNDISSSEEGIPEAQTKTSVSELTSIGTETQTSSSLTQDMPPIGSTSIAPGTPTPQSFQPGLVPETTIATETSEGRLPIPFPTAGPIRTGQWTMGLNYTKSFAAETVTTVTYVTLDVSNPTHLITTHVPVTLGYKPCHCDHQVYPPIDMTTIISPCRACGSNGEDTVTLTVPKAACDGGSIVNGLSHEGPYSPQRPEEQRVKPYIHGHADTKPTQEHQAEHLTGQSHKWPLSLTQGPVDKGDTKLIQEHEEDHLPDDFHERPSVPTQSSIDEGDTKPRETDFLPPVISAPQPDASAEPRRSQLQDQHQHFPSNTWTTELGATREVQDSETTSIFQSGVPWEKPDTPVIVSEASKCHLMSWMTIIAISIVGLLE